MNRFFLLITAGLFLAALIVPGCSARNASVPFTAYLTLQKGVPDEVGIDSGRLADIDAIIAEAISKGDAPGAVVIIGKDNKIIWEKAYGNRRIRPFAEPMTPDTIFDLASCSKVLGTSAMAMLLIQDGKLRLEDKVSKYIPEFAANGKDDVTVWNLMTHTSGLAAYCSWQEADKLRGDKSTSDALIHYIASLKKTYPTGDFYLYSCLNYLTLARVNETVAGESMHSFLQARIWEPLGITGAGYILTPEQIARTAPTSKGDSTTGVGIVHDPLANYHRATAEHCPGNAGLFMDSHAMAVMAQLVLNRGMYNNIRIYQPDIVSLWTRPHITLPQYDSKKPGNKGETNRRALGWINYLDPPYVTPKAPDGSFLGHTGWTGTYIWVDQHSGTFLIFNTNTVHPDGDPKIHSYRGRITTVLRESIIQYRD